jgi:fructose-bisphosphate aldolase class II
VATRAAPGRLALDNRRAAVLLAAEDAAPERVAAHLLESEPAGEAWPAETLVRAAAVARGRGASERAVAALERALSEPPPSAMCADVLARLGSAELEAGKVADALGTGERGHYLLAATFGNVHGVYAPGIVQLRPELLGEGQRALAGAHPGARFQYVFHGSSGSAAEDIQAAIYGVVKINIDSDTQYAFTRRSPTTCSPTTRAWFEPRAAWGTRRPTTRAPGGKLAEAAMAERVAAACELFGSAGRSVGA